MDAMMQLLLDKMALMEARITDAIEGRSSLSDTEATVGSRARNIPDSVAADLAADHIFGGAFGLDNLTPMAAQAPSAEEVPQPQAEVVASSESEPATYAELVAAPTKCSTIDLNRDIYSVPNPVLHRQHLLRDCDDNHVGVDVDILPTSEFDKGPIFDEEPCFHRSLMDSDPDSPYDWVIPVPSSPCDDDERIIALSSDCTATDSFRVGSVTDSGSESEPDRAVLWKWSLYTVVQMEATKQFRKLVLLDALKRDRPDAYTVQSVLGACTATGALSLGFCAHVLMLRELRDADHASAVSRDVFNNNLAVLENLLDFRPNLVDKVCGGTKLLCWLLMRINACEFDANEQYAFEVLNILLWGSRCHTTSEMEDAAKVFDEMLTKGDDDELCLCNIGLELPCTMEVQACGHQGASRVGWCCAATASPTFSSIVHRPI
jgi:hypothetical protein